MLALRSLPRLSLRAHARGCTSQAGPSGNGPACFGAGLSGGMLGGLIGLGGGVVMVPLMTAFARMTQHQAVGTSSLAVAAVGLSSCASFGSAGAVDYASAAAVATTAMVGARLGARLTSRFDATQLARVFAVFQICVAPMVPLKALLVKQAKGADSSGAPGGSAGAGGQAAAEEFRYGAAGGFRQDLVAMAATWREDKFWRELAEPVPAALALLDRADACAASEPKQAAALVAEATAILHELNGTLSYLADKAHAQGIEHAILTRALRAMADGEIVDTGGAAAAAAAKAAAVERGLAALSDPMRMVKERGGELATLTAVGLACGVAAGLFGIGGGVIVTPALCILTDMPYAMVLGTTLTSMVPPGLVSAATHHRLGNVLWASALPLCVGSALGASVSGQVAVRLPEEPLQRQPV